MNITHSGVAPAINVADNREVNTGLLILTDRQQRNFWSKVDKSGGPDACWIWTGSTRGGSAGVPYGGFGLNGKMRQSHVVSYLIHVGQVPKGMCICHNCPTGDNPRCVNSGHLWMGTKGDNNRDREEKGRGRPPIGDRHGSKTKPESVLRGDAHYSRISPWKMAIGDKNGQRTHPERTARGERQGRSVLKQWQVIEIRKMILNGNFTHREIGLKYGVARCTITAIVKGRIWAHLPIE